MDDEYLHGSDLGSFDFEKMADPFPDKDPAFRKTLLDKRDGPRRTETPGKELANIATGLGIGGQAALDHLVLTHGSSEFDLAMEATKQRVEVADVVRARLERIRKQGIGADTTGNTPSPDPTIRFNPEKREEGYTTQSLELKIQLANEIRDRFHSIVASLSTKEQAKLKSRGGSENQTRQKILKEKMGEEIKIRFQQVVQEHAARSNAAGGSRPVAFARENPRFKPFVSLSDLSTDVIHGLRRESGNGPVKQNRPSSTARVLNNSDYSNSTVLPPINNERRNIVATAISDSSKEKSASSSSLNSKSAVKPVALSSSSLTAKISDSKLKSASASSLTSKAMDRQQTVSESRSKSKSNSKTSLKTPSHVRSVHKLEDIKVIHFL